MAKNSSSGMEFDKKANGPVMGKGMMKDMDDDKDNQVPVMGFDHSNHYK